MNRYFKISIIFLISSGFFYTCTERGRNNPLDPDANGKPQIQLSVLSFNDRIELRWNQVNLTDFIGFNLYRKVHDDSSFFLYANGLSANQTNYTDSNIQLNEKHSYYITILGIQGESAPSNIVSTTPGFGYNWVVDKWGYQVVKTTYDGQYYIDRYYTDWPPQDIALDRANQIGLVTYPIGGRMDFVDLTDVSFIETFDRSDRNFIGNPYKVIFEPISDMFWISDSGGAVYRISSTNQSIELVSLDIDKSGEIVLNQNSGVIYIIDEKSDEIFRFTSNGGFIDKFSNIGDFIIKNPKYLDIDPSDEQFWLVEEFADQSYLYQGNLMQSQITLVDSFEYIADIEFNQTDQSVWAAIYENSIFKILQLSKGGDRQSELIGVYNPYSVTINPYDGTLLVADSGNGRIIHYNGDFDILGIFTNLNFPISIKVE